MQNKLLPLLYAGAMVMATGARAQNTTVATPSTPAPAVQQPAPQQAAAAPAQVAPMPNQIIYAPRLPSAAELTSAAAAQGQSVEQIIQSSSQITAVYRSSNGQVTTIAYQLLPTPGSTATTATVVTPAPTVIYQTAPRTIYYRSYDPFWDDDDYWYPPVSLSLGFGYYHGWGGGFHDRDDWHGGGWRGGGGWHRR